MEEGIRILVIEAGGDVGQYWTALLTAREDERWQWLQVQTLAAAVTQVQRSAFDVALAAWTLPDRAGVDLVRDWQRVAPHVPLVLVAAGQRAALGRAALAQGAQDVLEQAEMTGSLLTRSLIYAMERGRQRPVPPPAAPSPSPVVRSAEPLTALHAELDRRRTLFQAAPDGCMVLDDRADVVEVNDRLAAMLGYPVAAVLKLDPRQWDLGWNAAKILALEPTQAGPLHVETRHRRRDGSIYDAEVAVSCCQWQGQRFYLCVCRNISDRQQQALAQAETFVALQDSEQRHRALVEALPDLVMRVTRDGTYQDFFWPRNYKLFRTIALEGNNLFDGDLPQDLAEMRMAHIQTALDTGELQYYEQTIVVDGETRQEEVRINPISDDEVVILVRDITDNKAARTALAQSEATNRAIIEALPDLLIQMDLEGNYIQMLAGGDVKVQRAKEHPGKSDLFQLLPPQQAETRLQYARRAIATGCIQVYDQTLEMDGEQRHEEVRIVALNDREVLVIVRDISDRKVAEQELHRLNQELEARIDQRTAALRASESRFRGVFDQSPLGIAMTDLAGNITRANAALRLMLGYSQDDILQQTVQHLLAINADHPAYPLFDDLLDRTLPMVSFEQQCFPRQGDPLWIKVTGAGLLDGFGRPAGFLYLIDNITVEKETQATLVALSTLQQGILDSTDYAIISTDREGLVQTFNGGAERMLGYQAAAVIGTSALRFVDPQELQGHLQQLGGQLGRPVTDLAFQDLIAPTAAGQVHERNLTFLTQTGSPVPVALSISALRGPDRDLMGFVGVAKDMTTQRQTEQALRQINERLTLANADLHRATRLKDEFLANMSHELRTPLNAVLGMAEALADQVFGPVTPRQAKALNTIDTSGRHLLGLINDILDLSKVEAGKLELQTAPTSVHTLCHSGLTFVRQQAHKKSIRLELSVPPHLPPIDVDEQRLRQVLINLLSNAVKFTPQGGLVQLKAERCEPAPGENMPHLVLTVTDTGIGISAEHLPRLFQPFTQVDSRLNRQHEGTGLGLALVRRLVELHRGKVSVTSAVGQGSCFMVRLPYVAGTLPSTDTDGMTPAAAPVLSSAFAPAVSSGAGALSPSGQVLLVEDNDANAASMVDYLTSRNLILTRACNGQQALERAIAHPPDLILMDIQMPGMDGLETIRRIRAHPQINAIPIIALTALAMAEDEAACRDAGADDYLTKPVRLRLLLERILQLLSVPASGAAPGDKG
jgi:PAS domain S-box-containing protein